MQRTPSYLHSAGSVGPAADTLPPRGLAQATAISRRNTRRTGGWGAYGPVYIACAAFEVGDLDIPPTSPSDVLVVPAAVLALPHPYHTRPGTRPEMPTCQCHRVPAQDLRRRFIESRRRGSPTAAGRGSRTRRIPSRACSFLEDPP
jgi:hypothetical protein